MTLKRYHVEFRAKVDGSVLRGHAHVFGQLARDGGHWERLAPEAFDKALKDPGTDVRALLNHDPSLLLARQSAGTLRIDKDDEGLRFELDLPDTSYARDLRELVARGDITGASFGFIPGEDEITKAPDGRQLRTHTSVAQLIDVSPVTWPAYGETSVALRYHTFARLTAREQAIRARARLQGRK